MNDVSIDANSLGLLEDRLNQLTSGEVYKVIQSAIMAAGRQLKKATEQQLKADMGSKATRDVINGDKTYPPLISGVRMGTKNKDYLEVNVNIMGHGFLKWFEKGTSLRSTGSGANRGSISAINFFATAQSAAQSAMDSAVSQSIERSIDKLL